MTSINPDLAIRALFNDAPPPRRSSLAVFVSVALHTLALGGVTLLAVRAAVDPAVAPDKPLTFVSLALAPRAVFEVVPPPKTAPLVQPKIELPPPPPREVEKPVVTPPLKPDVPEPPPTPKPEVVPPKPQVVVGTFNSTPAVAAAIVKQPQVQSAGFDAQASVKQSTRPSNVAATGAFDPLPGRLPGGAPSAAVAPGGFDQAASSGGRLTARGGVVSTGFDGGGGGGGGARPSNPPQTVRASGFGDVRPDVKRDTQKPVAPALTPVEVTFKPTPEYTDEARSRHVEGEVILEVDFTAAGGVRVLRVVKGLGYGLDEMATRAASQMRFKPATEQGKPIDFRANVQIVFRLT
jgi:TonB family protein